MNKKGSKSISKMVIIKTNYRKWWQQYYANGLKFSQSVYRSLLRLISPVCQENYDDELLEKSNIEVFGFKGFAEQMKNIGKM